MTRAELIADALYYRRLASQSPKWSPFWRKLALRTITEANAGSKSYVKPTLAQALERGRSLP